MTIPYSIVVFLHVIAMLGLFIALGAEWLILLNLSRATDAVVERAWIRSSAILPILASRSLVLILLTGIYLAAAARAWTAAWLQVSLGAMLLIGFLGARVETRMRAMRRTAALDTGASLDTTIPKTPIRMRFTMALAIVLLMIARPGMGTSLAIVAVALAAGLLWSRR